MSEDAPIGLPQGIHRSHFTPSAGPWTRYLPLLVLGALLALAAAGVFGGGPSPDMVADSPAARLVVHSPRVIRNGQFFETRFTITPHRPIAKLVLAVTPSLWRDLTQNSMLPQADKEIFEEGLYRFEYGTHEAGKPIVIKADFQINPALFGNLSGAVLLLDGDTPITRLPLTMKVRP